MTRPLPAWAEAVAPVDMDGAARLLGVSRRYLVDVIGDHPHYERRGVRKVFYPEHIAALTRIVRPPVPTTPLEVIQHYVAVRLKPGEIAPWDEFMTQDFHAGVYLLRCNDRIKIGFTTDWARRLRVLRTACPYPVTIIAVLPGSRQLERVLHAAFTMLRKHGEWFDEQGDLAEVVKQIEGLERHE